jgi:hypothetical protein
LTRQDVNEALPQTSFLYGAMECGLSSLVLCSSQGRSARLRGAAAEEGDASDELRTRVRFAGAIELKGEARRLN